MVTIHATTGAGSVTLCRILPNGFDRSQFDIGLMTLSSAKDAAKGPDMPRYRFILQWSDKAQGDEHGTHLPDHDAACEYAHRVVRELKEDGGYNEPGLRMIVRDTNGKLIRSIPF
jgi:hypothetical protein